MSGLLRSAIIQKELQKDVNMPSLTTITFKLDPKVVDFSLKVSEFEHVVHNYGLFRTTMMYIR